MNVMCIQIQNMLTNLKLFEDAMILAAYKDNGILSKVEEKQLKDVSKSDMAFKKELLKAKE